MRFVFALLCVLPCVALADNLVPRGVLVGRVTEVIDGDTLRLKSQSHTTYTVRLLDINTPERARSGKPAQPLAQAAQVALTHMAMGQEVQVQLGKRVFDPYGRVLGHVFLNRDVPARWLNGQLVRMGLAHVYTFPDNRVYGPELLAQEEKARTERRGIWARPEWRIRDAATCCGEEDIGRFVLVEGTVRDAAVVRGTTYLNFGDNWRTDFSGMIEQGHARHFRSKALKAHGIPPLVAFNGKRVRLRGVAMPVNGVMIKLTHAEQIEILP